MNARASATRHRLQRRQVQRRHQLEHHRDVGLQPSYDAVVAARPVGAGAHEAEVVPSDHLVARRPVGVDAADVGKEDARLARHVGAHVPGVGGRIQRDGGAVVRRAGSSRPRRSASARSCRSPCSRRCARQSADPVDVLLDRHRHVRQHRRAARAGDGEEVGEADGGQPEVGRRAVGPLLLQRHAVPAGDVDGDERRRSSRRSRWRTRSRRTRTTRRPCRCRSR